MTLNNGITRVLQAVTTAVTMTTAVAALHAAERPLYLDASQPVEKRVEDLLSRLNTDEKLSLVHADSKFTTAAIPRFNIPRRWLSDGPHGVREDVGPDTWEPSGRTDDFATCMPASIALAATWNPDVSRIYGEVVGQEARKRGKDIMLGPGVNIMRTPLCGRNFEYLGEDPFLASRMVVEYIRAVQAHDVASCVKHFAANNQEWERGSINVEMDERTLREIYLPAFKAAIQEAGVLTIMPAYNKFRGQHCCQNDYLLNKILKGEWGFQGVTISDWGGVHDTRQAVLNGLDVEMGTDKPYNQFYLADAFKAGLEKGDYPMSVLNDKARRSLRVMFATHLFDKRSEGSINTPQHQAAARRVAEEAIVLLKNEAGMLPLDAGKIKSLAVIGENATRLQAYGGDSSRIKAFYEISPLQGILNRVGSKVNITYSEGCHKNADDGLAERAINAAKAADAVIFIGGINHDAGFDCEGKDRTSLSLPPGQAELIGKILKVNPRTVVVLVGGSPMDLNPWLGEAPAVMLSWYSGMEGGSAIARVLFGDVNPSGKLPCTFPKKLADSPAHALNAYPGTNGVVRYEEGIFVGYRWFDTKNIEPLFPFGHGLSYTRFDYSGLKLVKGGTASGPLVTVEFEIANTGDREGAEVAQIYVQDVQSSLPRPVKELKGFKKVSLKPGEKRKISLPLDQDAFAYFDPAKAAWVLEAGEFNIVVGSSSRDIRLQSSFNLDLSATPK